MIGEHVDIDIDIYPDLDITHQKLSSSTKSFLVYITMKNIGYPVGGPVRVVVEEHLQLVGAAGVVQ